MQDIAYWIALNEYAKFGPQSFQRLIDFFPTMEHAFRASANQLTLAGIQKKSAEAFIHFRAQINPKKLYEEAQKNDLHVLTLKDPDYPRLLKNIYDPPPVLFVDGYLPQDDTAKIAIVGSRKATGYGKRVAEEFSSYLAQQGVITVSGLAYGIDEIVHKATIQADGITLAVLGCGLLNIGTSRQRYLAAEIKDHGGAIISEFPLRAPGLRHHYPYRNRVISGLCTGTLAVEAAQKSGSLITAYSALDQGRDVYAIPGPIYSETSQGTNNLIKMGAYPVTEPKDILDIANITAPQQEQPTKPEPQSPEEKYILDLLSKNPIHIDEITRNTQLPSHIVARTLSLMEVRGRAHQIGGMYYVLGG